MGQQRHHHCHVDQPTGEGKGVVPPPLNAFSKSIILISACYHPFHPHSSMLPTDPIACHSQVKCSQYWPSSGTQDYANITVTIVDTSNFADFDVRRLKIQSVNAVIILAVAVMKVKLIRIITIL